MQPYLNEPERGEMRALLAPRPTRDLLDFTQVTFPRYRADAAHALIAGYLDAVVDDDLLRLMVFAPPQHGKSELVSVRLPAYWLGRRPDDPVILSSYAASLAESKSRQARQVVESLEFGQLFEHVTTRRDSRSVYHWELDGHRGGMLAVGVGGPITGHGALLGIIDDPVENWQQAQSQVVRDREWEWWRTTFRTRIWEGGAIVLVMTRWHEDDLAGRLLNEQGERWTVLRLPALAEAQPERDAANERLGLPTGQPDPLGREPDEAVCPRRFSRAALYEIKGDIGSQAWNAEYQGSPTPLEGNRFKRDWFSVLPVAPAVLDQRVRYWDKAATEDAGDYSAGVLMARAPDGRYYVLDAVRGQWSSHQRELMMVQTAATDRATYGEVWTWHPEDPGSAGKDSARETTRNLAGFSVSSERVTGDKLSRADPFASQCEAGNVLLVEGAWNKAWLDEICGFPSGAHDDQVDASSGAFSKVARYLHDVTAQPTTFKTVTDASPSDGDGLLAGHLRNRQLKVARNGVVTTERPQTSVGISVDGVTRSASSGQARGG